MPESTPRYKRILLKLSGESLAGTQKFGVNPQALEHMVNEIIPVVRSGVEVGLVIGGGNIFRGVELNAIGLNRVIGDQVGMLATVMNALILRNALTDRNVKTFLFSAMPISGIAESYDRSRALQQLSSKRVVIFAGGTGNPLFTTDSAACLRGIEMEADLVLKGTRVDGVYDKDPSQHEDANFIPRLTYHDLLTKQLKVMDLAAICLCEEHSMPIRVFNIEHPGQLMSIMQNDNYGTLITRHPA